MKLSREIKTGIIVIGGILLFILGFSYLKSSPLLDDSRTYYAVYSHVGGLQPGTQVTINGFSVGKVNNIRFKDGSGKLVVTFSVDNDFDFSKNSVAELYDTGIIGGKGIQIKPVFDSGPMAKNGDTLPSNIRPGVTELVQQKLTPLQAKVEGAVTNADSLLMNVNDVLDDNTKQNLQQTIEGLNRVVSSFEQSSAALNRLLQNNEGRLDSTLGNIHNLSANLEQITDSLQTAGISGSVRKLEATLNNLNAVLAKVESGDGTLGKLVNDQTLYNNLSEASRELDLLLQDFRLNPKRYVNVSVFGKKQKEYTLPDEDPAENVDP